MLCRPSQTVRDGEALLPFMAGGGASGAPVAEATPRQRLYDCNEARLFSAYVSRFDHKARARPAAAGAGRSVLQRQRQCHLS